MKIILDRRTCNCWDQACESHFGWHFLREEITPIDCTVDIIDDGRADKTFFIKDHDGQDKILVVTPDNWAEAYDSWVQAWQRQQRENE
jgi:hypothetical protein